MTNIFKILWFEDDSTWYNIASETLRRYIQERYCLNLSSKRNTGADFDPSILTKNNDYDLILMDYKLAAGQTGKAIVDLIRDNAVLTDILLYSSEYDKMVEALTTTGNPLIDGVFFANRKKELFDEKLHNVIHKIVRRSEDIVNLRGFFLDNTSDFEVRIKELINLTWEKIPNEHVMLEKVMVECLEGIEKYTAKTLGEVRESAPIYKSANNHKYALSIKNRIEILDKIITHLFENKLIKIPAEFEDLKNFAAKYSDEVSTYRNALSHKKYSDTTLRIKGKPITIDKAMHQKLRETINKYDRLIDYLEKSIVAL